MPHLSAFSWEEGHRRVLCNTNSDIQVVIYQPGSTVNTSLAERKEWRRGGGGGLYSQFFEIGEVLEHIGRKLSDVIHAQVTVETKTSVRKTNKKKNLDGINSSFRLLTAWFNASNISKTRKPVELFSNYTSLLSTLLVSSSIIYSKWFACFTRGQKGKHSSVYLHIVFPLRDAIFWMLLNIINTVWGLYNTVMGEYSD